MPTPETATPSTAVPDPQRRRLLARLWQLPLAAVSLQALAMLVSFAMPRKTAGSFGTVIDLGPLAEMPAGGSPPLHVSRGRFWLVNDREGAVALSHTCSHLDCLFNWDQESGRFVCPCHGSQFDRLGRVLNGPASRALDRYPLQIVSADGQVLAGSDEQGNPLPLPVPPSPSATDQGEKSSSAPADPGQQPRLAVDTGRRIVAGGNAA